MSDRGRLIDMVWRMREWRLSGFLPGLGQDAWCAWCVKLMPAASLQVHVCPNRPTGPRHLTACYTPDGISVDQCDCEEGKDHGP